jgi:hypothetical protein
MRDDTRKIHGGWLVILLLVNFVAWTAGALWIFVVHPWEGPVLFDISVEAGVHLTDPLGIILPTAVSALSLRAVRGGKSRS